MASTTTTDMSRGGTVCELCGLSHPQALIADCGHQTYLCKDCAKGFAGALERCEACEGSNRDDDPGSPEGDADPDPLNQNERRVFNALVASSAGNGHDFGLLQDLTGRWGSVEGLTAKQVGAYVTDLQDKGLLRVDGPVYIHDHGHDVTQFTLTDEGFRLAGIRR